VLKSAQDKYRQINSFIEILSSHLDKLPDGRPIRVIDMGSGKGYLTFALYDYLVSELGREARVTGVELRPELVAQCNQVARDSGLTGLDFEAGSIASFDCGAADAVIALHACDTATDDAIAKGIAAQAQLIVVAPCCHKQIRREIEAQGPAGDFDFMLKHGIFVERQAEMVTDAIRALVLEHFGYTAKVFDFVPDAHTPKNVLIVGDRRPDGRGDRHALERLNQAKRLFGVAEHYLERATGLTGARQGENA
jgi:SAM-dependent methyltransferase